MDWQERKSGSRRYLKRKGKKWTREREECGKALWEQGMWGGLGWRNKGMLKEGLVGTRTSAKKVAWDEGSLGRKGCGKKKCGKPRCCEMVVWEEMGVEKLV